jgi:pimeloyl-ACP methyl ester carboxylesterase
VLPWLAPEGREALPAYARRLGAQIPPGPVVLVGVSLGGMLAAELAGHPSVGAVVQVASCLGPHAIAPPARAAARAAIAMPARVLRPPRVVWPLVAWGFGARTGEGRAVIEHCIATADPRFVQWGLRAILDWEPGPVRADIHVHGTADRLIPASRVEATRLVDGAGHLVNVTHAAAVNEAIAAALATG